MTAADLTAADIEAIERATVAAVAPRRLVEADGWLIPLDDGAIGRAKSAAPLFHAASPGMIDAIEAVYAGARLPPAFRLADDNGLAAVRATLEARGYAPSRPTLVMIGDAVALAAHHAEAAELLTAPDAAWAAVFSGEGFDPADGASRAAALARAPDALFGQVEGVGGPVAVGVVNFGHGWAAISGLRTNLADRGKGYASRILAAFGRAAQDRGVERIFLQVEAHNTARALYGRAGFGDGWTYRYWTMPKEHG
ncbi:GNAT family N-acetyltransferase [Phenylobacterium immobile]|uniref:GNAT family N-acetyltransferase n=1 Tax=Phenylobacterium immobile TaxID=21 RepID=UPI000AE03C91|nr:GNAT family N-acetyltransferase [Phenylobacterium immobile]